MMKKKSMNHVVVYWLWALTLGSGSLLGAGVAFAEQGQATTLNGEGAVTVDSSTMTVETQAQGDAGSGATGETGDTDSSSGGDSGGNTVSGTLSDYVPQEEPIPQHEAVVPTETEEGEAASRASQLASQTLEIKDTNGRQTTYLASFDAKGYTGVKDVQFPVWSSQDGKDDLVWYKGAYNSKSQKWEARIDISKHKSPGNFQVHVYVQTANGAKELAAASSFEVTPPTITGQIDETGKANGTYTVKLQVSSVSGVSSLRMPIWSKANQSDIKWYDAVLQPDGSYQVVMDYKNHAYNGGAYNNHVYLTAGNGLTTAVALNKVTLAEPTLAGTLAIKDTNGKETTFTASFDTKNYPGVKSVQIPVWSADNGQDDLIWYSATYNSSTKKWEAKIDIANHKSSGVYNAHVYVNLTNGQKKAGGAGTFAITAPSVTGQIDETNKSKGQYTITLKPTSVSGVSSIRVPVWSKANQSDLKWYDAVRQSNGSYKVTVDYKNHSYNGGNYNNHVYLTASNGVQTAIALNKVTLQEPHSKGRWASKIPMASKPPTKPPSMPAVFPE